MNKMQFLVQSFFFQILQFDPGNRPFKSNALRKKAFQGEKCHLFYIAENSDSNSIMMIERVTFSVINFVDKMPSSSLAEESFQLILTNDD